ncbi:MAG TPA: hypothetical protein VK880_12635 [Anaerolineales bacterium]|nr:hypothetical protein [Anaerolineales bacterium]
MEKVVLDVSARFPDFIAASNNNPSGIEAWAPVNMTVRSPWIGYVARY